MDQRIRSRISERSFDIDDECDFGIIKRIKMESDGILSQEDDIMAHLQENADLEVEPSFTLECSNNGDDGNEGILQQHMDIREPLSTLRNLLEQRLGIELNDYSFWLQDSQKLESHKNLVDQCVQGEGLVQVNVQIKSAQKQINIVDVLKPAEEYTENNLINTEPDDWQLDLQYQKEMERLRIPKDPNEWTQPHVRHWLQWAVRQFNLVSIKLNDWNITGAQLCNMSQEEFNQKVPHDKDSIFWMHLEILKKFKTIAVNQKEPMTTTASELDDRNAKSSPQKLSKMRLSPVKEPQQQRMMTLTNYNTGSSLAPTSSRTMNSGQIQLWQFLLELLTDRQHKSAIHWVGDEGEFKLSEPENVAKLWGARKNKRSMNYEKLSRALRYYYDGDIISKVHGKRFVYKFVCDLKSLLGYSAAELKKLMDEGTKYY